ncbi:hypothetical protein [Dickeya zeae]|jgi:hypothetical protein|nr:hypothetical protein [Dickeya oryzae]MCO7260725.1 hypothetical protein [Dickeya zeae]
MSGVNRGVLCWICAESWREVAFPVPEPYGGFLNEDYCLYDSALGTTGAG